MPQAGPGQSARILIVDDELGIRNFVDRVLRNAGYTTALAPDGPEALKICEASNSFDLLVVDLAMPIMRGDELARRLRQATPALKVLYITGDSERLFQKLGYAPGVTFFNARSGNEVTVYQKALVTR